MKKKPPTNGPHDAATTFGNPWIARNRFFFTPITPRIGKLANLVSLDMSHNQLEEVPKEMGDLRNLVHLNLSNNELQAIPSVIFLLAKLETLDVSDNKIKAIQADIARLDQLRVCA